MKTRKLEMFGKIYSRQRAKLYRIKDEEIINEE